MPVERTEFQFEQRGGQDVLRALREIEKSAKGAAAAWRQMNNASVNARGGRTESQKVQLELAAMRQKTQELRNQATAERTTAEAVRQAGRIRVAELQRASAAERNLIAQQRLQAQASRRSASEARRAGAIMRAAFAAASGAARGLVSALTAVPRALLRIATSPLGLLAGGAGAFLGVRSIVNASDTYLNVANRIAATNELAARSTAALVATQRELFDIANRSRAPIDELSELYGRLALGAREAAGSQQRVLQITETIAKSTAIGGGTPESVRGALIQFSQIVGAGGAARGIGQELRSIREQAPYLFLIMAEGLQKIGVTANGTTTELEKLAEQGNLTADQVMRAVLSMSDEVEERFKRITPPINQALTVLSNSWIRFIGTLSSRTGAGQSVAATIIDIANRLDQSAEKFAERANTIINTVRRVYFMELPPEDAAQAKRQLDRITESLTRSVLAMLGTVGKSLFEIVATAAQIFADAVSSGVRRGLGRVLFDLAQQPPLSLLSGAGESGRTGFTLLSPEDQLLALTRDYNRVTNQISAESRTGGVPVSVIQAQTRLRGEIEETRRKIADMQATQLDAARAASELGAKLIENVQTLKAGLTEAWVPAVDAIDTVTEEQRSHLSVLDQLHQAYGRATDALSDYIREQDVQLVKLENYERISKDVMREFSKSLEERRLRAAGLDKEADRLRYMNEKAAESVKIIKELKGQLSGLPDAMREGLIGDAEAQLQRLVADELRRFEFERGIAAQISALGGARSQYERALEMANLRRELGQLNAFQVDQATIAATDQYLASVRSVIGEMERMQSNPLFGEEAKSALEDARIEAIKLEAELKNLDPSNWGAGLSDGVTDITDKLVTLRQAAEHTGGVLTNALGTGVYDAMDSVIRGTESMSEAFRNLASSVLSDLSRMIYQLVIFNSLSAAFGGGGTFLGITGLASGGVINRGQQLQTYAQGGVFDGGYVVDRATIFPMANGMGLMGEAGPEAVMPLERGRDGKLGVNASGADGVGVVVAPVLVTDSGGLDRMLSSKEADASLARLVRSGGAFASAVKGAR